MPCVQDRNRASAVARDSIEAIRVCLVDNCAVSLEEDILILEGSSRCKVDCARPQWVVVCVRRRSREGFTLDCVPATELWHTPNYTNRLSNLCLFQHVESDGYLSAGAGRRRAGRCNSCSGSCGSRACHDLSKISGTNSSDLRRVGLPKATLSGVRQITGTVTGSVDSSDISKSVTTRSTVAK